jgi:hypothetical protein
LVAKVYYFQEDTESAKEWIMSQLKKDGLLWLLLHHFQEQE